jgi:hypothetical protein
MTTEEAVNELSKYAAAYRDGDLAVRRASVAIAESQDGVLVSRLALLLSDPLGETWDLDRVNRMRDELGRKATEVGLPPVTLTLVAESEPEADEAFAPDE